MKESGVSSKKISARLTMALLTFALSSVVIGCAPGTPEAVPPTATAGPIATAQAPTDTPVPPSTTQDAEPVADAVSLLEERCTKCHSLGRVESAQKSEAEWTETVQRMVGRGATLTEEEQAAVIEYLTTTYGAPLD